MSESNKLLFSRLYSQFYGMVLQLSLGFLKGDKAQAEDLCQEVFIQVWNHLEGFRQQSSYKTWIYRITVNCCLNYIKKSKKDAVGIDSSGRDLAEQQEEQEGGGDDIQRLYRALAQLEEVDRLLVSMLLEELTYEEIAEVLGISQVNLRVKIHRVKKKLKKLMNHE